MAPRSRTLAHPLSGADPATLIRALWLNGGVDRGSRLRLAGIAGSAIGRLPFSAAERVWAGLAAPKRLDPPPVFIIGHWRSGTTHLYNIMAKGDFAYVPPIATGLPWDLLLIGGLFRPLLEKALPGGRAIDNVPVTPDSPQEDEIALASMTTLSFYHALYFPRRFEDHLNAGLFLEGVPEHEIERWERRVRHLYAKLVLSQGGRRLLIKNPVYTGRVAQLARMFPGAKFINMVRNPYEVFVSMRNFYEKLLPELALQDYSGVDIDRAVLSVYPRLLDRLEADRKALPEGDIVDLRYEDLDCDATGTVRRAYEALGLDGYDAARPEFERYLASIKTYQKNRFAFPDDVVRLVDEHWSDHVSAQGYAPPGEGAA